MEEPAAGAAGWSERAVAVDARPCVMALRCAYFAIQVTMRAEVLSRWSAQNASSIRK